MAWLDFPTTNNAAKYEVLLHGLCKAKALETRHLVIKSDYRLVLGPVNKTYQARDPGMVRYLAAVRALEKHFRDITVQTIP